MTRTRQHAADGPDPLHGWLGSGERDRARARLIIFGALTAAILAFAVLEYALHRQLRVSVRSGLGIAAMMAIGGMLVGAWTCSSYFSARAKFRERRGRATRAAEEAALKGSVGPELAALLLENRKQMEKYDFMARDQAESAYRYGRAAMVVGLVTLIAGTGTAIAVGPTASKITTAGLAAVGGVLASYVARTFLRTYQWTLAQLNYYFEEPLITSYILTAERLTALVEAAERDAIRMRMIDHIMNARIFRRDVHADGKGGEAIPRPSSTAGLTSSTLRVGRHT